MKRLVRKINLGVYFFLAFYFSVFSAFATEVTVEQVKLAVSNWLTLSKNFFQQQGVSNEITEVAPYTDSDGNVLYYLVQLASGGTVVTSAKLEVEPIIAFSPNGIQHQKDSAIYDLLNNDLCSRYKSLDNEQNGSTTIQLRQLQSANLEQNITFSKWDSLLNPKPTLVLSGAYSVNSPSTISVYPLLGSMWNQGGWYGNPYSWYTPENTYAGCGIVALAQILAYYDCFSSMSEDNKNAKYNIKIIKNGVEETISTPLEWDNTYFYRKYLPWRIVDKVPDWPGSRYPEDDFGGQLVVGKLMQVCGALLGAKYIIGEGTGSYLEKFSDILYNYFKFSGATYKEINTSDGISLSTALSKIQYELSRKRLVALAIFNNRSDSGHAVIVDGIGNVAETQYYHINMGWGGNGNIWYNLQDMSISSYNFNVIDAILYDLRPQGWQDLSGYIGIYPESTIEMLEKTFIDIHTPHTCFASYGSTNNYIDIDWRPYTAGETYTIKRTPDSTTSSPETILTQNATGVYYKDTTAQRGQLYEYSVIRNSDGKIFENKQCGIIHVLPPTGLSCQGIESGIKLSWQPSEGADKYYIYRAGPFSSEEEAYAVEFKDLQQEGNPVAGNLTSYVDTTVGAKGDWYAYAIRAFCDPTGLSDAENIKIKPCKTYTPPITLSDNLTLSGSLNESTKKVSLSWTAVPNADYYEVWRNSTLLGTFLDTQAQVPHNLYTRTIYRVRAVKDSYPADLYSAFSNPVEILLKPTTPTIALSQPNPDESAVKVTIGNIRKGVCYKVWRYSDMGQEPAMIKSFVAGVDGVHYFTDNGVVFGLNYSYYVEAVPDVYSSIASIKLLQGVSPTYPTVSKHVIIFDFRGGYGGTKFVYVTNGGTLPNINPPTKAGYVFDGYYSEPNGRGTKYYAASGVGLRTWDRPGSATLYAKWISESGGGNSGGGGSGGGNPGGGEGSGGNPEEGEGEGEGEGGGGNPGGEDVVLSSITISGPSQISSGSSGEYNCVATYSNGSTEVITPTWSISTGSSYASISSSGVLTAYNTTVSRSVTIKASYNGKVATKVITINPSEEPDIGDETRPGNDNFADAYTLTGASGSVNGSNDEATLESGEPAPSCQYDYGASVWWKWTAPATGTVVFDTIDSDFDTILAVYTGSSLSSLSEVSSDDDNGGGYTSRCEFDVVSGTTYYIAVYGYSDNQGEICLNWELSDAFDGGIAWEYEIVDGEAIITGVAEEISGDITIPSTLGGYPVTSIGYRAFYVCSGLTSVTIPDSVTSIGDGAFEYCSGLTSVTIGDGVTSIGYRAFYACEGLTSVTIPDSVTSIGDGAFQHCSGLTSVTIGGGVTSIGEQAFCWCEGLTSVTIPDSVTSIGDAAFYGCSGLIKFIVDSNNQIYKSVNNLLLTKDGKILIAGINGDVVIPQGVTSIGNRAFDGCRGLTSVTIPDSVTSIGEYAFDGCSGLIKFIVDSNNPNLKSVNNLLLTKDGKILIHGVNGDVVIPQGVTSIGNRAFDGCRGLTSVTIPDSVMRIEGSAFYSCEGLTSITIPDSVTSIGGYAFYNCSGLTSVTIPDSVTRIGDGAFEYCSGLESFIVDSNNPSYKSVNGLLLSKDGKNLIAGVNGDVVIPQGVTSIGNRAFDGCRGLTSVTIPDSVTSIGEYAFDGCSGLTSVTIPDSVTSIGGRAFYGCSDLLYDTTTIQGVVLVDGWVVDYTASCPSVLDLTGVRGIVGSAFSGCSGLTSVTIPDSVTSIGRYAFSGCSGLTSVTIPDSVTSIGRYAFSGCSDLLYDTTTIQGVVLVDGWVVDYTDECPSNLDLTGVRGIAGGAFCLCEGLTSVTIPQGVTSIGDYAFDCCSGLTSVTIPQGVTSIGDYAFFGCWDLTSVTIPQGVTSIGDSAFNECVSLTSITIPDSVTSIGQQAFQECIKLKSVFIPASVLYIGEMAFLGCDLADFNISPNNPNYKFLGGAVLSKDGKRLIQGTSKVEVIPDGVVYIEDYAFTYVRVDKLVIPASVVSIGEAFDESAISSFYVSPDNANYTSTNGLLLSKDGRTLIAGINGNVVIPQGVTRIGKYAFGSRSGLTSVTIPDSVTSIGDNAFYCCGGLTSVTIPDSVTSIGDDMFAYCRNLTSVTIGSGVASIGDDAFRNCNLLKSAIFLGDAPRNVGDYIFDHCADDFTIKVKKGTKGWDGDYTSTDLPATWHGYPIEYATESDLNLTYKVAFNANGGSGSMAAQTIACNTWTKLRANAFNRTGYTFQGWAKSKTGAVAYKNAASVKNLASSGTVTLYAVWKPNTYKVAFNANGGKGKMSAQTITYNTWTKLRANAFKRTGYTFQGWAKSKTGAVAYKNAASVKNLASSGTVTLYAIWKPNTYKVAFNANGGKGKMSANSMTYGKTAKLRANAFKRSGYVFIGWAKSKKGAVAYKNAASVKNLRSSGTITLYAVWAKKNYKVAFYANGGKGKMSAQTFTYGKAAKLKKNAFKRSGYTFIGWAKSASLAKKGTVSYKNTQAIKNLTTKGSTIKLYAVWAKTKYKVAFYANGGKGKMSAQTFTYGKAAKLKKNAFKRTGYAFKGWAKSSSLAKKGTVSYKNTQSIKNLVKNGKTVKLYAVWKRK